MSAQNTEIPHTIKLFNKLCTHPNTDVEEARHVIGTGYQEIIFKLIQDNVLIEGNFELLDENSYAFAVQYIINDELSFEYTREDGKNTIANISPEGTLHKTETQDDCITLTLSNANSEVLVTLIQKPDFPLFLLDKD